MPKYESKYEPIDNNVSLLAGTDWLLCLRFLKHQYNAYIINEIQNTANKIIKNVVPTTSGTKDGITWLQLIIKLIFYLLSKPAMAFTFLCQYITVPGR